MHTYIVLLRGVMPTGKNRVPMADLRKALTEAGFTNVVTWIQSGNAVVTTPLSPMETAQKVQDTIRESIGPELAVIVKTAEEIQQALLENPFVEEPRQDRVFYALYNTPPDKEKADLMQTKGWGEDRLHITQRCAYLFIPGSAARSKLNNAALERGLGISVTVRNRNTLSKMLLLTAQEP